MDTLALIKNALSKDNNLADSLLKSLSVRAYTYGSEYGLPMSQEDQVELMRLDVVRWLLSIEEQAK